MSTESDRTPADPLAEAIDLAARSAGEGGGPFGAVLVHGGRVVARGTNRVVLDRDPTAHAEIVAIREAARRLGTHDLSGAVLYSSCEPCPMCVSAIHWARIERIEYAADRHAAARAGFDDELLYRELDLAPTARSVPATRRLAERGEEPFDAWRANPERAPY